MTVSSTRGWKKWLSAWLAAVLLAAATAYAGSIEPLRAALTPTEDGYALSAEFAVELGPRLEEAVGRGLPLYFTVEFDLVRPRWYWSNEHIVDRRLEYRLAYNALTRQYRLSLGSLHQSFESLSDAMRVISRIVALPVAEKGALKIGETYNAALRLSLDRSQLPKPLQLDALADRDWQVDTKPLRWQFTAPPPEAK